MISHAKLDLSNPTPLPPLDNFGGQRNMLDQSIRIPLTQWGQWLVTIFDMILSPKVSKSV
jgi:hypothetical protein